MKDSDFLFELAKNITNVYVAGLKTGQEMKTMNEPNYDSHLEPIRRRRDPDEVDDALREEYLDFLESLSPADLLKRISVSRAQAAKDALVEIVTESDDLGHLDKDFQATVDWEAIHYEER